MYMTQIEEKINKYTGLKTYWAIQLKLNKPDQTTLRLRPVSAWVSFMHCYPISKILHFWQMQRKDPKEICKLLSFMFILNQINKNNCTALVPWLKVWSIFNSILSAHSASVPSFSSLCTSYSANFCIIHLHITPPKVLKAQNNRYCCHEKTAAKNMSAFFWLKILVSFPFCILKCADICALCFQCSIIENALMYNLKQ